MSQYPDQSPPGQRVEKIERVETHTSSNGRGPWAWLLLGSLVLLGGVVLFAMLAQRYLSQMDEVSAVKVDLAEHRSELKALGDQVAEQKKRVEEKNADIERLTRSLSAEREARKSDATELETLRKSSAEVESTVAEARKSIGERDEARKQLAEMTEARTKLQAQVDSLTKRLDEQSQTIARLESDLARSVAERNELRDMLRVCQERAGVASGIAVGPASAPMPVAPRVDMSRLPSSTQSTGAPAPFHPVRSGAASQGPATDARPSSRFKPRYVQTTDGSGGTVRQVEDSTMGAAGEGEPLFTPRDGVRTTTTTTRTARTTTWTLEWPDGYDAHTEPGLPRMPANLESITPPPSNVRVSWVGRNHASKSVGTVGRVPDAVGNFFVGMGERLDTWLTGTQYVKSDEVVVKRETKYYVNPTYKRIHEPSDPHSGSPR